MFFVVLNIGLLKQRRRISPFLSGTTIHHGLKHQSTFNGELVIQQSLPDLITLKHPFVVGQKTQVPAHIDTQNGNVMNSKMARCPQNCSITSENHGQIRHGVLIGQQAWEGIHPSA